MEEQVYTIYPSHLKWDSTKNICQDHKWFLSMLYALETVVDEQEETKNYVQYNFKKVSVDG
tara:strand:- start:52 stop:234 length:183 start_codon:yes stop_codon:yes gene_type:complete